MRIVRTILVLGFLTAPSVIGVAEACVCAANPPCAAAWQADAVFVATALEGVEEHLGGHLYWTVQKLQVTRVLRGSPGASVTMVPLNRPDAEQIAASLAHEKVQAGINSCAYGFRLGDDYLVYATRTDDGRWTTGRCSGTKPLAEAQADLDYFNSLGTAAPVGRIYGTIQRTIADPDAPGKTLVVPAAGVDIAVGIGARRTTVTSNAQGRIDVQLPPGDYSVFPSVPDSVRAYGGPRNVTLAARGCAPVNFSLISNGRIEGRVVHDDGSAASGISVRAVPASVMPSPLLEFTTAPAGTSDKEGRFKIDAVLPGTYLLIANPSGPDLRSPYPTTYFPVGGRTEAAPIEIGDGERKTDYTITVTRLSEAVVAGRVVFTDGEPAAGAILIVYPAEARGHVVTTGRADESGAFRLRVLAGATYRMMAGFHVPGGDHMTEFTVSVAQAVDDLTLSIQRWPRRALPSRTPR